MSVRPKVHRTIAGGLLGTIILVMLMYPVGHLMLGKQMDVIILLVNMLEIPAVVGVFLFVFNGVLIFPLIYGFVAFRMLWGSPWIRGLEWGLLLWFIGNLIIVSTIKGSIIYYHPQGVLIFIVSLVGHIIYGSILGAVTDGR